MKIFIGLGNICGYYSQLEKGLKNLGVSCVFVNAYPNLSYQRCQRPGTMGKIVEYLGNKRVNARRGGIQRSFWKTLQGFSLMLLLLSTLPSFDVYIFSGGITFFGLYDLWLLKFFRKKIIMVFHGSDSRPPYINAVTVGIQGDFDVASCISETEKMKKKTRQIERYADFIINHSMNSHFHERVIINWLSIGIPYDSSGKSEVGSNISTAGGSCVIVHAPTRPGPKGSVRIETAIEALREKGHKIEFVKLVDRPNTEVLAALAGCDFVVDEMFSDTTMATFATEAAAFGKPAIVGMYGYEKLQKSTEQSMIPPSLVCRPEEIKAAIERLLVDTEYRLCLGLKAQQFVEQQWNTEQVAKRFLLLLTNKIPQEWWFDPRSIDYLHGWGLTEQRVREVVRVIIESYGMSALQLSDKPILEQAFVNFAHGSQKLC